VVVVAGTVVVVAGTVVVVVGAIVVVDALLMHTGSVAEVVASPRSKMGTNAIADMRCVEERMERTSTTPTTIENRATSMRTVFPPVWGILQICDSNIGLTYTHCG
jgi:hypothetical protein